MYAITKNLFVVPVVNSLEHKVVVDMNGINVTIDKSDILLYKDDLDKALMTKTTLLSSACHKINNYEELEKICSDIPFKPHTPNFYDMVNNKFILEMNEKTYIYENESLIDIDNLPIDYIHFNKGNSIPFRLSHIKDMYNEMKFKIEFNKFDEDQKYKLHEIAVNQYYIKVKDFENVFIATRKNGNGETEYFEKVEDYFYVKRGDGQEYKYNLSSVEYYIEVDCYLEHVIDIFEGKYD